MICGYYKSYGGCCDICACCGRCRRCGGCPQGSWPRPRPWPVVPRPPIWYSHSAVETARKLIRY